MLFAPAEQHQPFVQRKSTEKGFSGVRLVGVFVGLLFLVVRGGRRRGRWGGREGVEGRGGARVEECYRVDTAGSS